MESGIFGFRGCLTAELEELKQNLSVDVLQILHYHPGPGVQRVTPAAILPSDDILLACPAPMAPPAARSRAGSPTAGSPSANPPTSNAPAPFPAPSAPPASESMPPVFIQGPSAEETMNFLQQNMQNLTATGTHRTLGSILKPALPAGAAASGLPPTLETYQRLVEDELKKINHQQDTPVAEGAGVIHKDVVMEDLRLFTELLLSEQGRVEEWSHHAQDKTAPASGAQSRLQGRSVVPADEIEDYQKDLVSGIMPIYEAPVVLKPPSWHKLLEKKVAVPLLALAAAAIVGLGVFAISTYSRVAAINDGVHLLLSGDADAALTVLDRVVKQEPGNSFGYFFPRHCQR